ncbi:hypothetical protein HY488_00035, partial [Candidatus Woesearchaeota archaeon]|nr:hypothetical protein [Candidatus Woesearchaeota archaeon]
MKRFSIIFVLVAIVLFLVACSKTYVCPRGGGTAPSLQECPGYGLYVQDYALIMEDLPDDYLIDEDETGIQLGSEISENDLQYGWKEGYFCGFVKPDKNEEFIEEGVYCFVSRYDAQSLVGIFASNESINTTSFDAPKIGDASVAYYIYDPENDASVYT